MIEFIRSLFKKVKSPKEESEDVTEEIHRDFIDYDGMGNQGRFPMRKDNPRSRR